MSNITAYMEKLTMAKAREQDPRQWVQVSSSRSSFPHTTWECSVDMMLHGEMGTGTWRLDVGEFMHIPAEAVFALLERFEERAVSALDDARSALLRKLDARTEGSSEPGDPFPQCPYLYMPKYAGMKVMNRDLPSEEIYKEKLAQFVPDKAWVEEFLGLKEEGT